MQREGKRNFVPVPEIFCGAASFGAESFETW